MGRPRSETRERAFQMWMESGGKIKLVDLAAQLAIPDSKVRKWKAIDKWDKKPKGALPKKKGSAPKLPGAPKGNRNASGHGAPEQNKNAERHGFFSRIFPDDPETLAIVESIGLKSPLDILWENIVIQYTAIARAQRLMFVKDKDDLTKILKRQKETSGPQSDGWEKEYELQFAWDKHANFLQAQSRAIKTLDGLVARYEEMLPGALQYEEQRLRVEKLKAEISKINGGEDSGEDDGFLDALKGQTEEVWSDED